mmetsp:Transcript_67915/g.208082  ORF Transcript_67915/g.208082 Transcript_67915/m.208082 type:complete len:211 (-) Transcript_67915:244-876(-)
MSAANFIFLAERCLFASLTTSASGLETSTASPSKSCKRAVNLSFDNSLPSHLVYNCWISAARLAQYAAFTSSIGASLAAPHSEARSSGLARSSRPKRSSPPSPHPRATTAGGAAAMPAPKSSSPASGPLAAPPLPARPGWPLQPPTSPPRCGVGGPWSGGPRGPSSCGRDGETTVLWAPPGSSGEACVGAPGAGLGGSGGGKPRASSRGP